MNHLPAYQYSDIQHEAILAGLRVIGFASTLDVSEEQDRLREWQRSGYAADLSYMLRSPELFTSMKHVLPNARSYIMVSLYYDRQDPGPRPHGTGRVARYAWGRDYHKVFQKRLTSLARTLSAGDSGSARIFSDAVPLLERSYAKKAGLGFIGKNTLLIRPGEGSFFLLGGIIFDREILGTSLPIVKNSCGSCHRCITQCPTGAIREAYQLDASRCISYLTIEKRGVLSSEERSLLGEWIFGCDICQEVCPFNYGAKKRGSRSSISELGIDAGVGPYLDLERVLHLRTHEEFVKIFQGTALMRAKREGLIRNAMIVAVYTGYDAVIPLLQDSAVQDESPVVRAHALDALWKFQDQYGALSKATLEIVLQKSQFDSAAEVQHERQTILASW